MFYTKQPDITQLYLIIGCGSFEWRAHRSKQATSQLRVSENQHRVQTQRQENVSRSFALSAYLKPQPWPKVSQDLFTSVFTSSSSRVKFRKEISWLLYKYRHQHVGQSLANMVSPDHKMEKPSELWPKLSLRNENRHSRCTPDPESQDPQSSERTAGKTAAPCSVRSHPTDRKFKHQHLSRLQCDQTEISPPPSHFCLTPVCQWFNVWRRSAALCAGQAGSVEKLWLK